VLEDGHLMVSNADEKSTWRIYAKDPGFSKGVKA